jgi:hypothetical protein
MDRSDSFFMCAMSATKEIPASFYSMADYLAATMLALGCQRMNSAFKTIEIA